MRKTKDDLIQENQWLFRRVEELEEKVRILESELKIVTSVRDKLYENLKIFGSDDRTVGDIKRLNK